jgi:hypothetical protein
MNALLATITSGWKNLTDKQKMIVAITELGCPIDRVGRTSFWAAGRRYIFDDNGNGSCIKVLNYTTDGRISHSARPSD